MGRYRSTRWLSTRAALLSPGKSQLSPSITPNPPVDAQSVRCSPSPSRSKSASFRQSNVLYRPSQVAALGYFGAWGVSRSLCFVIRRLWQPTGVTSQRNKTIIISLLFDRLFFCFSERKEEEENQKKGKKRENIWTDTFLRSLSPSDHVEPAGGEWTSPFPRGIHWEL